MYLQWMMGAVFFSFFLILQVDPPFKPSEEFEIKFDLSFKQRIQLDSKTVHLAETEKERERRTSSTPLPYLKLHVKLLEIQTEETRLKITKDDRHVVLNKRIEEGMEFTIEVGFTDDVKDKISGYKHIIQFLSKDKKVISIILIEFDEDGNYMVNGEKRGRV